MTRSALHNTTPAIGSNDDDRWSAVCARAAGDQDFVYAVRTTGIYCRPGCASRRPHRENVAFFADGAAAETAGFRPCLRCRPGQAVPSPLAEAIAQACRTIETAETPPVLAELAAEAGVSPFHFLRRFKAAVGLTPAAYARARRAERMRQALQETGSVTGAIYEAGFSSSGRFYETSNRSLGMKPTAYRNRGRGEAIRYAFGEAWSGQVLVAATDRGVCAITLGDDRDALLQDLKQRFGEAELAPAGPDFQATVNQVLALVAAPGGAHALPLDIRGAAFQQRVWQALMQIPAGSTASYTEVAAAIGAPKSARAVARACAGNSLALAVPCHRVVRADGSLSGYRWGVERKRAILEREKRAAADAKAG